MTENTTQRLAREREEYLAVAAPHQERIRELSRLIDVEERHIEMKRRALRMTRDGIVLVDPRSRQSRTT